MKEINVNQITEAIASMAADIACIYDPAVFNAIQKASRNERDEKSKTVMDMLLSNAEIAQKERIPLCQDTGLMIVWLHVGQDVHFVGGNVNEAVNEGEIKKKKYSLSAGQYFDVKIEYVELTQEEFNEKMNTYQNQLQEYFLESTRLQKEIIEQLKKVKYE